jgi:hypothetical protein
MHRVRWVRILLIVLTLSRSSLHPSIGRNMDYGMIQGAIVSLKAASDIAIAFGNLKTMSDVQGKAIELQQIILSAQSGALAAQSQHFTLLDQIRELEKELARVKAWEEQKQRYALVSPFRGAVTYALKKESSGSEPPHWICANCYENGKKTILHASKTADGWATMACTVCKTHITSRFRNAPQLTYAEETIPQE